MRNGFKTQHWLDENGTPTGGVSYGTGFTITWQNGPLVQGAERQPPNGAFVEDIIGAAKERVAFYQSFPKFACPENLEAIKHLESALTALDNRTKNRQARGVEGTHDA